jgi:hypothetical protein
VLEEAGEVVLEQRLDHNSESYERSVEACRAAGSLWKPGCILPG